MGYSYAAKAGYVFQALGEIARRGTTNHSSNGLPDGFYETSRVEHNDGSITGTVFKTVKTLTNEERKAEAVARGFGDHPDWVGDPVVRRGSFKISGDGKVVRFPGVSKAAKAEAEKAGAAKYLAVHGA
jgi:hypothetical protein